MFAFSLKTRFDTKPLEDSTQLMFCTLDSQFHPQTKEGTGSVDSAPFSLQCKNASNHQDCISPTQICDGKPQCKDGSDEHNCQAHTCLESQFKCTNPPMCIPASQKCDMKANCNDSSDEKSCGKQSSISGHVASAGSVAQMNLVAVMVLVVLVIVIIVEFLKGTGSQSVVSVWQHTLGG